MKTWEVFKQLTDHPEKKFRTVRNESPRNVSTLQISTLGYFYLEIENDKDNPTYQKLDTGFNGNIRAEEEWTEIIEQDNEEWLVEDILRREA